MYQAKKICTIGNSPYKPGDPVKPEDIKGKEEKYLEKGFIEKVADKTQTRKQKDKGAENGTK